MRKALFGALTALALASVTAKAAEIYIPDPIGDINHYLVGGTFITSAFFDKTPSGAQAKLSPSAKGLKYKTSERIPLPRPDPRPHKGMAAAAK